jgi:hypothetical protein
MMTASTVVIAIIRPTTVDGVEVVAPNHITAGKMSVLEEIDVGRETTGEFVYGLGRQTSLRGGTEVEAEAGVLSETFATQTTTANDVEAEALEALAESALVTARLHLHDPHRLIHLVPQMVQADQMTLMTVPLVWQL